MNLKLKLIALSLLSSVVLYASPEKVLTDTLGATYVAQSPAEILRGVNNQPYVIESVVVARGAKLVALVYMDRSEEHTSELQSLY